MNIYPTILTDSLEIFTQQLDTTQSLPEVEVVQIDIIDGFFADDLTITPADLNDHEWGDLKCDLHLMVDEPLDFVLEAEALKNQVPIRSIIAQLEHMTSQQAYLEEVKAHQWRVGLSLDIDTPIESIDEEMWDKLDLIQLMGNRAGLQGQNLHPHIFSKIKEVKEKLATFTNFHLELVIDIGVKPDNVQQLLQAGVDSVAVGSLIWQAADPQQAVEDLLLAANE
jgi:ribulose-phosphate 3-epimerase